MLIIPSIKVASNVPNGSSGCYLSGDKIGKFVVPDNCEMVILCEKDMEDFFLDDDSLPALMNAFSATDSPHSADIGMSNIQKMVSSLRR